MLYLITVYCITPFQYVGYLYKCHIIVMKNENVILTFINWKISTTSLILMDLFQFT